MNSVQIIPAKVGQICKIIHPAAEEDPNEVYIVAEDPADFEDGDNIYIVALSVLQRNIRQPAFAPQIAIIKSDLAVIADDLESYIKTWKN